MKNHSGERILHAEPIQKLLSPWWSIKNTERPAIGWIKSIRLALGLTSQQVADRLGIAQPNVTSLEGREVLKTISLESLDKVAKAMNCTLVYAIIPNQEFDDDRPTEPQEDEISLLQRSLRSPH